MTTPFTPQTFSIPEINGISNKSIEEHIGLYQGYVKNWNAICTEMTTLMPEVEKYPHSMAELERRLSFEFGGMRLHEYYFRHLENGAKELGADSLLRKAIEEKYGSIERLKTMMKNIGLMRGPGWAILYWDPVSKQLLSGFSGEQHQGHFATLPIILAMDVWEHTYILDYGAAGKGKYIDAFLAAINWDSCEKNFTEAQR